MNNNFIFIIFLIRYTFTVDANEIIRAYVVIFSRFAAFPLIAYAAIDTAIIAVSIISAAVKINRNIYAVKLELIIFLMYSPVFFTFLPPCIFLQFQSKSSDHKFIDSVFHTIYHFFNLFFRKQIEIQISKIIRTAPSAP